MTKKLSRKEVASLGAIAKNKKYYKIRIDEYRKAPNRCCYCKADILHIPSRKLSETKRKSFCDSSCSAKSSNKKRIRVKKTPVKKEKKKRVSTLEKISKGGLKARRNGYQSWRSYFSRNAIVVFNASGKTRSCLQCGYERKVDICHKIPVSEFSDDALISDINNIDNLIPLCKNHHWEYDNGFLKL